MGFRRFNAKDFKSPVPGGTLFATEIKYFLYYLHRMMSFIPKADI